MRQPVADLVRQGLTAAALTPPDIAGAGKRSPLMFPANQAGRAAEAYVSENMLLEKPAAEGIAPPSLTEKGWDWLRNQGAPVLNDFLRQLEQWKDQDRVLMAKIRENSARLERLEIALKNMLVRSGGGGTVSPGGDFNLKELILGVLSSGLYGAGRVSGASCDISLPNLFHQIGSNAHPKLTSGAFQDALRELHREGKVLFHPWTGTLYSIPEPEFAFLVGHEVAYYVSLKGPVE